VQPGQPSRWLATRATPIDDGTTSLCQCRDDPEADDSTQERITWDRAMVDEDRDIFEATEDVLCLAIRRRDACHRASDKPGLLMRQMLIELVRQPGEPEVQR